MDSTTIRNRTYLPLAILTAAMTVLAVVCAAGLVLDPRMLTGAPIWEKPLKFSISFVIYTATLAVLVPWARGARTRRFARRAADVVILTSCLEMVAIVGQVVRGRTSHFDVATRFDLTVWAVMAVSIVVLWVATAAIGAVLLKERSLPPVLSRAVILGFGLTLVGMAVAFLMPPAARTHAPDGHLLTAGAHTIGAPDGGPGLPLLNWSTTAGDLRIAHFVGLHALQALPLLALGLGLAASRMSVLRPESTRIRLVTVAGAAYLGLILLLTWQALRAQPLIHPDGLTLGVLGVLVAATVVAVEVTLRPATRPGAGGGPQA